MEPQAGLIRRFRSSKMAGMGEKEKFRRLFRRVSAIGLALIFCLFTAGCKKAEDEVVSPLSPPAWIQGSWADQGYINKDDFGYRWVFTQDNAIGYTYRQGTQFLGPSDYFKMFMDCLKEDSVFNCSLLDSSSDSYYEIHQVLEYKSNKYRTQITFMFTKLTPTTFHMENMSWGRVSDCGIYTKE
jgi:hypothetical protein